MLIAAFVASVVSDIFRKYYSDNFQINKTGDKVDPVDIIYCTFQKASDKALYKRLLRKINNHKVESKNPINYRMGRSCSRWREAQ